MDCVIGNFDTRVIFANDSLVFEVVIHQNVPGQPEKIISGIIDNDTDCIQAGSYTFGPRVPQF